MPIIMPSLYQSTDRDQEIWLVMDLISHAMTGSRAVPLYELAERIIDELDGMRAYNDEDPACLDSLDEEPSPEPALSAADERRLKAARDAYLARKRSAVVAPLKPRIRVRAATQHAV
jgi:hypothetical protein